MTSGGLRNQCGIKPWMYFSCTYVICLRRNHAENVFLVLIFHSSELLLLYTDVCIAMLTNKHSPDWAATCRSQANVIPFAGSGILQWGEACGSYECPSWGGGYLGSHRIGLRDASRHPMIVLCTSTAAVFGSPGPHELRGGSTTDYRRVRVLPSPVPQVNEVTCRVCKSCGKRCCPWEISHIHVEG